MSTSVVVEAGTSETATWVAETKTEAIKIKSRGRPHEKKLDTGYILIFNQSESSIGTDGLMHINIAIIFVVSHLTIFSISPSPNTWSISEKNCDARWTCVNVVYTLGKKESRLIKLSLFLFVFSFSVSEKDTIYIYHSLCYY